MRETADRVLFWVQPGTAVVAVGFSLLYFGYLETYSYALHLGVGALATAVLIMPGLALSLLVNQLLLSRRPQPRQVTIAEGTLFAVQAVLAVLLVWQAFDQWSIAALVIAPLMIGVAIATTVLLARRPRTGIPAD